MKEPAPVSELENRFSMLRHQGLSHSQIAKQLHVSKTTPIKWERILCFAIRLRKEIDVPVQPAPLTEDTGAFPSSEYIYDERQRQP